MRSQCILSPLLLAISVGKLLGQVLPLPLPTGQPTPTSEINATLDNRTLANATSPSSSQDELVAQALRLVIGDASVVRLHSFEANTSSECRWPQCAAYCSPCAKTSKYWSCILDKRCQANSECLVVTCWAEPGFCYADAVPKTARCMMGAVPDRPRFFINDQILRFGLAGPIPRPEEIDEWYGWCLAALLLPVLYLIAATAVAIATGIFIKRGDTQWQCLPKSPWPVLALLVLSTIVLIGAEVFRQRSLDEDYTGLEAQIHKTADMVDRIRRDVGSLIDQEVQYNRSLNSAAGTCGSSNPLATELVNSLAGTLTSQLDEVHVMLHVVSESLDSSSTLIRNFAGNQMKFYYFWFKWGPKIPVFLFYAAIFILLFVTQLMGLFHLKHSLSRLAPVVAFFILFSAILSTLYLYVSIVLAGGCKNIDENFVQLAEQTDLNALVKEKYNVNGVLQHTARYYVAGLNVNPFATLIQNIQSVLYMILNFYEQLQWIVDAAAASCSGLDQLTPAPLIRVLLNGTDDAMHMVHAKNIWGYYDLIVHETVCRRTPTLFLLSFWMLAIQGLVLIPVLAMMADQHLQHDELIETARSLEIDLAESDVAPYTVEVHSKLHSYEPAQRAYFLEKLEKHTKLHKVSEWLQMASPGGSTGEGRTDSYKRLAVGDQDETYYRTPEFAPVATAAPASEEGSSDDESAQQDTTSNGASTARSERASRNLSRGTSSDLVASSRCGC